MLQALYIDVAKVNWDATHVVMAITYVSTVYLKCFICFKQMLQDFYLDVAKVDLDVAYICMLQAYVSSVFRCFTCMFGSVLSGCCLCLQWFSNVFHVFSQEFLLVSSV
jgi:hypothetical protein